MNRYTSWLMAGLLSLLVGCASLPPQGDRTPSQALADTADTRLGKAIAPLVAANPNRSGIHPLPVPNEAFAARVLLAQAAERSLDVQYNIWHGDETGTMLFEALWRAAERGVRVRLLLDDVNTSGLDETLAVLEAHPNIELRLYNPVVYREWRAVNFLTDFTRVNHRMHNKSFTADSVAAIVGGRNVGNEYFGAEADVTFADLDVLAIGPAAQSVSAEFDLYWNSASAYPAAPLVGAAPPGAAERRQARVAAVHADPNSASYAESVRQSNFVNDLLAGRLHYDWVETRLVHDDPAKTLAPSPQADQLLLSGLIKAIGPPVKSLDLVSPYFVPGVEGTARLTELARQGVKIRVLTNSLSSSDVGAVHAGYAKRRRDLLSAGIRLFEIKRSGNAEAAGTQHKAGSSSGSSLHAKTFALDGSRIFVGSFNFDPRSALLNTEMGLVIYSPRLAGQLVAAFDDRIPLLAYEVVLAADGQSLQWIDRTPAGEVRLDTEPETSALRRMGVGVLSLLPIDWML
jgi:putative cardiolipin synthase